MSYPDLLDSEWNAIEQIKGRSSELEASLSTTLATNKAKYQSFGETFKCLFTVSDLRESSTASSRRSIRNSPRLGLYGMTYDLWDVDWKLAGTLDAFRWPPIKPMSCCYWLAESHCYPAFRNLAACLYCLAPSFIHFINMSPKTLLTLSHSKTQT